MFDVVAWLGELPPVLVYVVAVALIFAETGLIIGLVLPGEVTLIFVGFLCSLGTLNPYLAATLMIAGAGPVVGSRCPDSGSGLARRDGHGPTRCSTGTAVERCF